MTKRANVREHVLKMISLIEKLMDLEVKLNVDIQIDLILQSLSDSFGGFISNFYINKNRVHPSGTIEYVEHCARKYEAECCDGCCPFLVRLRRGQIRKRLVKHRRLPNELSKRRENL